MNGLMMDYPLTLSTILRRCAQIHPAREVVTWLPDKRWHRYGYRDMALRAKRLALALMRLGLKPGDRIATLCWNHHQHLEAYFGVPIYGGVLHTLNLRLHPNDLAYIVKDADDRAIIVDESLLPVLESIRPEVNFDHVIVIGAGGKIPEGMLDYEMLLANEDDTCFVYPELDENCAAMMCYTSGTTGKPKGVVYSHRALTLHSFAGAMSCGFDIREMDCILPVVPMFHVNAWGWPYIAAMVGAKQVFTCGHLDPESLLQAFVQEKVTVTAGVQTLWLRILDMLDADPKAYDLSALRMILVGGSALPKAVLAAYEQRHQLCLVHAWGMTETTPLGTISRLRPGDETEPIEEQHARRVRPGPPVPFVEIRARHEDDFTPWDGVAMGELEVRGPWVAKAYYNRPDATDRFTEDGWFRTGDIVSIDERGSIRIEDRAKDLVKSGGEWISSLDLANLLMEHPAIAEASVIAIPHPEWDERPLAIIELCEGESVSEEELCAYLSTRVAKWWIPDSFEFVDALPKTTLGKVDKTALRARFASGS